MRAGCTETREGSLRYFEEMAPASGSYSAAMGPCKVCQLPAPVPPPIDFVRPGEPIPVWSGVAYRLDHGKPSLSCPARLTLVWRRTFTLELALDEPATGWWSGSDLRQEAEVGFQIGSGIGTLPVYRRTDDIGWCNGGVLGDPETPVATARALLANQLRILGGTVRDHQADAEWSGHWSIVADGWAITIDASPTLTEDFAASKRDETFALTHTVQVARADGATFTQLQASNLFFGLQIGLSFAAGYWVGVVCPTGYDRENRVVWMEVGPPHNGRARRCGAWFNDTRPEDLQEFLVKLLPQWRDPSPTDPLRSAMTSSILSRDSGFVEQRLITAMSALDTLSWARDVLDGGQSTTSWRQESASTHLTRLLKWLHIDAGYDDAPGRDAITSWGRSVGHLDLTSAVVGVRNAVTHPKPGRDIYAHGGVLFQALQVAANWLQLAILRRLDYEGEAADTADLTR